MRRLLSQSVRRFAIMDLKVDVKTKNMEEPTVTTSKSTTPIKMEMPPEIALGALAVCEFHTAKFHAQKLGIKLKDIQFKNVNAKFDIAGFKGEEGHKPEFTEVNMDVIVDSDADDKKFDQLVKAVEKFCPIYYLFSKSAKNMNIKWKKAK